MARSIPPLNPLHVFEVAARLGSFTKAAEELNVTQSAVSRQIGTLEVYLDVRLFHRDRAGVSLTRAGRDYFSDIETAFATIAVSTNRLLMKDGARNLHVSVYPTFAVKWLGTRLDDFRAEYPSIQLRITATVKEPDYVGQGVDIAVRLLPDEEAESHFIRLFADELQPVCSPRLLDKLGKRPVQIKDILQFQLLHSRYRRNDWRDWLEFKGQSEVVGTGIEFPSSVLTYQAAIEGLGVAIGQPQLLEQEFRKKKLIPLFDPPLARTLSYYVVWPRNVEPNFRTRAFIFWLQRQLGFNNELPTED